MLKKVISFIFIFLFVAITPFSIYFELENKAYAAVDDLILNNSYNRYIIGSLLVASGMFYNSTTKLDNDINDFINEWNDHETGWQMPGGDNNPKKWAELLLYITSVGVTVYDIGLDKTKQVIDIPGNVVDFFKSYVNLKFNVGDNFSILNKYQNLGNTNDVTYSLLTDTPKIYYYVMKNDDTLQLLKTLQYKPELGGYKRIDVTYDTNLYSNPFYLTVKNVSSSRIEYYNGSKMFDAISPTTSKYCIISSETLATGTTDITYPEPIIGNESGYGSPGVVDNEDYIYTNYQTGYSTIVIPENATEEDLINKNYQDIASTDTSGIPIPGTITPTEPGTEVPLPTMPGEDVATEEDFDNSNKRLLYQKKFPFCLPWDIKSIFTLLKAEAKAPYFEIDIIPSSLKSDIGITKDTEFIFDMGQFPLVSKVTRFFSLISFCLALILVTRNIIKS